MIDEGREPGSDDDRDELIPLGELVKMFALGHRPVGAEPPARMSDYERRMRGPDWRLERLRRRVEKLVAELRAEGDYNERLADRQVELGRVGLARDFRALARDCRVAADDLEQPPSGDAVLVAGLLAAGAHETRPCKLCGGLLFLVGPRRVPFDKDGQRHESTCPNRPRKGA